LTRGGGRPLLIIRLDTPALRRAVGQRPKPRPVLLAWTAAALMGISGCRPGCSFRLPVATSCASTTRYSVWVRDHPANGCCGPSVHRRPDPARRVVAPRGRLSRAPLLRFLSPSAHLGRVALPGVAVLRTIPLRRSPFPQPGRLDRPLLFGTSPLRSYADTRGDCSLRECRSDSGHAPSIFPGRCSATQPDEPAA